MNLVGFTSLPPTRGLPIKAEEKRLGLASSRADGPVASHRTGHSPEDPSEFTDPCGTDGDGGALPETIRALGSDSSGGCPQPPQPRSHPSQLQALPGLCSNVQKVSGGVAASRVRVGKPQSPGETTFLPGFLRPASPGVKGPAGSCRLLSSWREERVRGTKTTS